MGGIGGQHEMAVHKRVIFGVKSLTHIQENLRREKQCKVQSITLLFSKEEHLRKQRKRVRVGYSFAGTVCP